MTKVSLKNVTKSWGSKTAVRDISLDINAGELVALLGPSGCGKSTNLMMLAGLYAPTEGDILFDGVRVNDAEPRDRNVGIVFQSYALYPNMTVRENILFPLRFQKKDPNAERRMRDMADLVEIGALLDRKPGQLSGGQQQRVALARALIKRPGLLLLDEPLSNLDATLRQTMRTEIRRIQLELGVTTILVTHDQLEAMTMADRVVCMNVGKIEQIGLPKDLYQRPKTQFVANFIGTPAINLFSLEQSADGLFCGRYRLRGYAGPYSSDLTLGLRPENINLCNAGFAARVEGIEMMGRETLYLLSTLFGPMRVLEAGSIPRHNVGDSLCVSWQPEDLMLFAEDGTRLETEELAFFDECAA